MPEALRDLEIGSTRKYTICLGCDTTDVLATFILMTLLQLLCSVEAYRGSGVSPMGAEETRRVIDDYTGQIGIDHPELAQRLASGFGLGSEKLLLDVLSTEAEAGESDAGDDQLLEALEPGIRQPCGFASNSGQSLVRICLCHWYGTRV